jgi:energy-converting hydrogenase B subunit D
MMALGWIFDLLLVSALLYLAATVLSERDLFKAVVLFIAFGLLMALAWVRLQAPDIALAEAAVSAGITGVLMLDTLGDLEGGEWSGDRRIPPSRSDGKTE